MKVRITQPGSERFNGQMGALTFEEGLSTTDVSERDFMRLSAVMRVEREDGSTSSPIDVFLAAANIGAPTPEAALQAELEANAAALAASAQPEGDKPSTPVSTVLSVEPTRYTETQLAEIADKEGIKGLRKIAEPLGIKGTSIKQLIDDLLEGGKA